LVTPAGGTVLVEEPEAHLHPFGQFELANFVADHSNVNNRQFLITTHSERFLAGLLWQVRQEVLDPSDIIVHYFTLDEDGHSVHQRKGVTHGGIVEGSFREFFPPPDVPDWEEFFRGLG
jgi:predicted ATPase